MQKINRKNKISVNVPMSKKEAKEYKFDSKNYAIYCDHLKIVFNEKQQDELLILKDFNEKFPRNKTYFIVGDSGVGKTTLASHFNGLLKSKHGNIFIENSRIIGQKKKIRKFKQLRKSVGMVLQFPEYQLFKDTVIKDVMFGPVNLGTDKTKAREVSEQALQRMEIDKIYYSRSPFELSGGQKRRVAIAGILAIEPSIIIFDEPTAGLDPMGIQEMLKIIADLKKQNKTIFVITHNMNHVLELADSVILLGNQQVLAYETPYELFQDNELLSKTTIIKPQIIRMIESLVEKNAKFKKLYEFQPRTINELAIGINKVIGG